MVNRKFEKSHILSGNLFNNPELHILYKRLPQQSLMIAYGRPNSPFVKTFIILMLRGILQEYRDFAWRVSEDRVGIVSS